MKVIIHWDWFRWDWDRFWREGPRTCLWLTIGAVIGHWIAKALLQWGGWTS